MRQDSVTFDTSHTLWINTNHLPQVDTTDHGTWRRLKALPFPFKYLKPGQTPYQPNERVGDRTLKVRLRRDEGVASAALTWMVEGARQWFERDMVMPNDPDVVAEAGAGWRATADVGYQFAAEWLAADPNSFISADTMRKLFCEFPYITR
jgi:putative DNA primase/helicase